MCTRQLSYLLKSSNRKVFQSLWKKLGNQWAGEGISNALCLPNSRTYNLEKLKLDFGAQCYGNFGTSAAACRKDRYVTIFKKVTLSSVLRYPLLYFQNFPSWVPFSKICNSSGRFCDAFSDLRFPIYASDLHGTNNPHECGRGLRVLGLC